MRCHKSVTIQFLTRPGLKGLNMPMLTVDEIEGSQHVLFRQQIEDLPDAVLLPTLTNIYELRKIAPPSLSASQARDMISDVLAERAARPQPVFAPPVEPSYPAEPPSPMHPTLVEEEPPQPVAYAPDLPLDHAPSEGGAWHADPGSDETAYPHAEPNAYHETTAPSEEPPPAAWVEPSVAPRQEAAAEADDEPARRVTRRSSLPPLVLGSGLALVAILAVLLILYLNQG